MILITGATGAIGTELCQLVAQQNIPARVMCRKENQLATFRNMGLEAVLGDFSQPESLQKAMQGCQRLFLLTTPGFEQVQRDKQAVGYAVEAGVQHIVRLSTADANLSANLIWAKWHAEADHYLRSQPVGWTILRPTGFMQNFIESGRAIAQGILPHRMGEGQLSYIDLRDVALVASKVLTQDGHRGATYYLTGPESLTVSEVSSHLSVVLGHAINDVNLTETEMHNVLLAAGLPGWYIDGLMEQYAIGAGGNEIDVTEEIERLTGQAPRTFAQFTQDYKEQFISH